MEYGVRGYWGMENGVQGYWGMENGVSECMSCVCVCARVSE